MTDAARQHGELRLDAWTVEHSPTLDVWCQFCTDWVSFPTTWTLQRVIRKWADHVGGHQRLEGRDSKTKRGKAKKKKQAPRPVSPG